VEDSATAEISRSQVWQWIRQAGLCNKILVPRSSFLALNFFRPRNTIFRCQVLVFTLEFLLLICVILLVFLMLAKQSLENRHIQFLAWIEI
jgi:hypothetical protein